MDQPRGYGRFLHELVGALSQMNHGHRFVMFLDRSAASEFPSFPDFEVREVRLSTGIGDAAKHDSNRSPADLYRMGRAVAAEPLDVFFFPDRLLVFPAMEAGAHGSRVFTIRSRTAIRNSLSRGSGRGSCGKRRCASPFIKRTW